MLAAAVVVGVILVASWLAIARPWTQPPSCPTIANHPEWSVARRWDEALLDAIRRALPAPTVHARNLFHVSAAMWDAWATYDPQASGYFTHEKQTASDVTEARNEAISYAAYRVLTERYIKAVGADKDLSEFDDLMDALCYPLDVTTTTGNSPAAVGNRIAQTVIAYVLADGSPRITVTQGDVRAIQLAKAALYAGARLLMDAYGVDEVDEVRLAGAFGSHIDVKHAMVLGLVPDCDLDRVS